MQYTKTATCFSIALHDRYPLHVVSKTPVWAVTAHVLQDFSYICFVSLMYSS